MFCSNSKCCFSCLNLARYLGWRLSAIIYEIPPRADITQLIFIETISHLKKAGEKEQEKKSSKCEAEVMLGWLCHLVIRSSQAVISRGGYLAVQSNWVLFMSETGNNQTNILIKYLCSVSEIDSGIGISHPIPLVALGPCQFPTPIPWSLILWIFRSAEIQCWRVKALLSLMRGHWKLGRGHWEGDRLWSSEALAKKSYFWSHKFYIKLFNLNTFYVLRFWPPNCLANKIHSSVSFLSVKNNRDSDSLSMRYWFHFGQEQ